MAELFYRNDRDNDFFIACEKARKDIGGYFSVKKIVSIALQTPAHSFYLHPREYANIIRRVRSSYLPRSKASRALYLEVFDRYKKLKEKYPDKKIEEIYKLLADEPAPRFYISESRGVTLYYQLLKK